MKINLWLNWLFFGIILCCAVSIANLSGMCSVDGNFYNTGKVLDCSENYYRNNTEIVDGYWNVNSEKYVNYLFFGPNDVKWNYFCMDIDQMNKDSIVAYLNYYNSQNEMELLYTQEISLEEGNNIIKTECKKFDFVGVFIFDENGTVLHVDSIQLRQKKPITNMKNRFTKRFLFLFVIYIICSCLLLPIWKRIPIIKGLDFLLKQLVKLFHYLNKMIYVFMKKIPEVAKHVIRICIFIFMICYFNLTSVHIVFPLSAKSRTWILSVLILVVAITLSTEESGEQKWNNSLTRYWLVYNICTIISDILVKKKLMYQGWILLFLFGYFIYCWNNQDKKEKLLKEIFMSIHVYFVIMTISCCLFRPDIYIRYQGTFSNPVTFGAYVAIIACIAFIELMNCLKMQRIPKRIVFFVLEFLITISFIWKTQARSSLLPIVLIMCVCAWNYAIRMQFLRKRFLCMMGIMVVMLVPLYTTIDYIVQTVPIKLNSTITLENDGYQPDDPSVLKENGDVSLGRSGVVYAESTSIEEIDSIRFFQKFKINSLEAITSGRTLYWKGYLREMNLFGHNHYAYVLGKKQHPHCSLMMIAYRYGVFSVIPYIFMLGYAFLYAFEYMVKNSKKEGISYIEYPIFIILVFLSISLFDVAEYLYSGFGWLLFNISIGLLFCHKSQSEEDTLDKILKDNGKCN